VFVYGKEISDMHTIEYDRIYTLGISATQELNKKLEAEMAKNQLLETESKKKIAELEKMLQTLKGENKKLSAEVTETKTKQEQEIAALKKQMEKIMNIVGAEAKK
jgi:molecular chaperone GrpE (heat shock protein)